MGKLPRYILEYCIELLTAVEVEGFDRVLHAKHRLRESESVGHVGLVAPLDDLHPVSIRIKREGQAFHLAFVGALLELHTFRLQQCARRIHVGRHDGNVAETSVGSHIAATDLEIWIVLGAVVMRKL